MMIKKSTLMVVCASFGLMIFAASGIQTPSAGRRPFLRSFTPPSYQTQSAAGFRTPLFTKKTIKKIAPGFKTTVRRDLRAQRRAQRALPSISVLRIQGQGAPATGVGVGLGLGGSTIGSRSTSYSYAGSGVPFGRTDIGQPPPSAGFSAGAMPQSRAGAGAQQSRFRFPRFRFGGAGQQQQAGTGTQPRRWYQFRFGGARQQPEAGAGAQQRPWYQRFRFGGARQQPGAGAGAQQRPWYQRFRFGGARQQPEAGAGAQQRPWYQRFNFRRGQQPGAQQGATPPPRRPDPVVKAQQDRAAALSFLGLGTDATPQEVRRVYMQKSLQLHPDKGGSDAAFQELGRHYGVLQQQRQDPYLVP